jgi:ABC-type multidrug transport system fused ATPase/permease subunit
VLKDLRAILGWVEGRLRLRWALLIPVMSVAALLEAVAAIAVFGLLRIVVEPHRVRTTPLVSELWRAWPTDNPPAIIATLTIVVGLFYVARALYLAWAEWLKESTIAQSGSRAAERLFARYLAADYPFHLQRRSSHLIQEVARSTDLAFQLFIGSMINLLAEIATIGVLVGVLAVTAPPQTLVTVAAVLAIAAIPMIATRRVWVRAGERQCTLETEQLHVLQQSLGAVKEVKIAGREAFFESRLRAVRRALARTKQHRLMVGNALRLTIETVLILCMLAVVLLITLRGASSADTVSMLALFAYTGFRVVPSANRIMLNTGWMREGHAFVQGALADFRTLTLTGARSAGPEPALAFTQSLVCDDVSFAYEGESPRALSQVNLVLRPGESLGIVGETGSGKSTLVDVLLGLLQPTSGRVLIDGENLAGRERAWHRLVGYVPQTPYLLDDTVRRNIAFGVLDASIDEHRLARAATLARLDEVVRQLHLGFDTPLGEHGTRLSGGQRQRVAIARALYADPAVLVFDEATAALDNQTEREVTAAIQSLHGARTLIVIAHRLSTVQDCDRLIFMQDGRIAATGTYNELLGNPVFRSMAATHSVKVRTTS